MLVIFLALAGVGVTTASPLEKTCENDKMYISNQVTVNLWYKRDGGQCSLLNKHNIFMVFPGESLQIYSNSDCTTKYCSDSLTQKDVKSADLDGDCRVRILNDCAISDM